MIEKLVGETGFEPATLCSQSKQETNGFNASGVNWAKNRTNRINDLQIGCKPEGGSKLDAHLVALFGAPQEPEQQFRSWVRRGLERYTYFARGDWTGRIKIGRSNEPTRRVRELWRAPNGEAAKLVAILRGESFETLYHRRFAAHAVGNEWFLPHADLEAEIAALIAMGASA